MKRFYTSLGYVDIYEPYQPEGEPLWQRGVSRLCQLDGTLLYEVGTTDIGTQALADCVERLYMEVLNQRNEEVEERIREEGSEESRD